jgi:hypothetical protein
MGLHRNIDAVDASLHSVGKGFNVKMLLSGDETPNFAMRNFIIEAGGHSPFNPTGSHLGQFC